MTSNSKMHDPSVLSLTWRTMRSKGCLDAGVCIDVGVFIEIF